MTSPLLRLIVLVLIALAGCTSSSDRDNNDVASQSSDHDPPATSGAGNPTFVNDTPEAAARNFFGGIANNNIDQAKSAVVPINDEMVLYLQANIDLIRAMDDFARADAEAFGAEGSPPVGSMQANLLNAIDTSEPVPLDDSRVEWAFNPASPMLLTKTTDGWKIDFRDPKYDDYLRSARTTFEVTARVFDEVRQGILAKRITSRDEARKELGRLREKHNL
jgi:hypothetical protein